MLIKAVLFDLDDTLWPIVPVIRRAENLMFDWLSLHAPGVAASVSIEDMRRRRQELMATDPIYQLDLRELRRAVLLEAFRRSGGDIAMVDEAMDVFSQARNEVEPYADVAPALALLRQRYALGTISNGVADLETIGLAHFFEVSVAAYRFGSAKPDPAIFLSACESLRISPAQALYVGDDPVLDVQGAQGAGMRAALIDRPGRNAAEGLPDGVRPDLVCKDLHEVCQWLEKEA